MCMRVRGGYPHLISLTPINNNHLQLTIDMLIINIMSMQYTHRSLAAITILEIA